MVCRVFLILNQDFNIPSEKVNETDVFKKVESKEDLDNIIRWLLEGKIPTMTFFQEKEQMQVIFMLDEDATAFKLRWT